MANKARKPNFSTVPLTASEKETLILICGGLTSDKIGRKMFRSKRTIERYRQNLLMKTRAKNMADLIVWAFRNKIVE